MARLFFSPVLLFCAMTACAVTALGQSPAPSPAFEVATIKPSSESSPPSSVKSFPGGRLETTNYTLRMPIKWAYDVADDRLSGAPKWLDDDHFDIVAKSPDVKPPVGQFQIMMRSLLKDRFQLKFHNERRELTSYALVIDKAVPRVHVVDAAGGFPSNPFSMTDSGRLTGTKVTATMPAKVLSEQLRRPVQDMTGFKEAFDFTLEWAPATVAESADFRNRPSIFTALRDQPGFRLDARKTPADVFVIDQIERSPSPN